MRLAPIAGAAALLASAVPLRAETASPTIVATGQASADVTPDRAVLTIGVETEAASAPAAASEVATRAKTVIDGIKGEGIAGSEVATGMVSVTPLYPDRPPASGVRAPRAFRAATTLSVAVRPADRAGLVAAHLIDLGASSVDGVAFVADEAPQRLDGLRRAAVEDARHKAEVTAAALGLHLGDVVDVSPESNAGEPLYRARSDAVLRAGAGAIPVEPGVVPLRAAVTIRWQLGR